MKYSMCSAFILHTPDFILSYIRRYTFKGSRHSVSLAVLFYFLFYQYLLKKQIAELQAQLEVEMTKNTNFSDGTLPIHKRNKERKP